jgi:aminodeoxyfutalosine deaminase
MKAFSADYLFCGNDLVIKNGVIVLDDSGNITEILHPSQNSNFVSKSEIIQLKGILAPGFVNTHCHLELSAYYNKIRTGCSVDGFIRALEVEKRTVPSSPNDIAVADKAMWDEGIVAVADICNTAETIEAKSQSKIYYHNFVEVFGSNARSAEKIFLHAEIIAQQFSDARLPVSITPHSLYACSEPLMKLIQHNKNHSLTLHFMESEEENDFFEFRKGKIIERAELFGVTPDHYCNIRKRPSEIAILALKPNRKLLFVHNTMATSEDLKHLCNTFSNNAWFCLCPNSNLYIENRLPNIELMLQHTQNITIGTDSLASNHKLSILKELITIAHHFPKIPTATLLQWATRNGAKFLDIEDKFGSLEVGKAPGLNHIVCDNFDLRSAEKVNKLF